MRFLIKYATRGRPNLFTMRMDNIKNTISNDADYEVLVTADKDDVTMQYFKEENFKNTRIFFGNSTNKIEAINADMLYAKDWDILINFSDDMLFTVNDWDKIIEKDVTETWKDLDFFAHYNDGYVGDKLPTMSIMGRAYYERFNYIYHPSYKSESCDAEAMYVSMMLGKHKYFPKVIFRHEHPCNNGTRTDATYELNGRYATSDHKNYFDRLKNYFYVENPVTVPFNPDDYR